MITEGYTIRDDEGAVGGKTITCHKCGMTSYNPNVPCCGVCNRAKSDLSAGEFIAWAKRVART